MDWDAMERAGHLCRLLRQVVLFGAGPEEGLDELGRWLAALIPDRAGEVLAWFRARLPELEALLREDLRAAYEGDPAAGEEREILLAYPGMLAVTVYRLAHELWEREVPLLPRLMTEYAHSVTGIDIHPGAVIGRRFFIDHGTGVVIGETAVIGDRVKLYQGVTLGGLSTRGGQNLRGQKRHPTLEDDVTVYANATILGGDTVIGHGSTVGANVFLTHSVLPQTTVIPRHQELILHTEE